MANITGTGFNDNLPGTTEDDTITAGGGADSVTANSGNDTVFGGTGNDTLRGQDGNDSILGENNADSLYGGIGADSLYGGGGPDRLFGEDGDDLLVGGGGADTMDGGSGIDTADYTGTNDTISANLDTGFVFGAAGNDILSLIENLIGGNANDTLTGDENANALTGGSGNDSLIGGTGDDTLTGGSGSDSMAAGDGNDTADFSGATSGVTVNLVTGSATGEGTDTLSGFENVIGSGLGDQITGTVDANLIDSGAGNDTISSDLGDDTILAGDGADSIVTGPETGTTTPLAFTWSTYADETSLAAPLTQAVGGMEVSVTYSQGIAGATITAETTGDALAGERESPIYVEGGEPFDPNSSAELYRPSDGGGTTVTSVTFDFAATAGTGLSDEVENVTFRISDLDLSGFTDSVTVLAYDAEGNEVAVVITESSASLSVSGNTVTATGGAVLPDDPTGSVLYEIAGPVATLVISYTDLGNAQQAIRVSDVHFDAVEADADLVEAGAGDDTVSGGFDADTLLGQDGNDSLSGGEGNDLLDGGIGADALAGGAGNDSILGDSGADAISGDDGDDTLSGGDDADTIGGGAGNDVVAGDGGDDVLSGGAGFDTLTGGDGADALAGEDDADSLEGGAGNDTLDGGAGDDTLRGGADADLLQGGAGVDDLDGGSGDDTLSGDAGQDLLVGGDGNDVLDGGADADTISGGLGSDTILGAPGDVVDGGEDAGDGDIDVLDLSSFGFSRTDIVYDTLDPESGTVTFYEVDGVTPAGTLNFTNIERVIACFTPGTLVTTATGERPVETLRAGDLVLTRDRGFQPLIWAGRRDLTAQELAAQPAMRPVRIAKGALGQGMPRSDMQVSPQHRMLMSGPRAELFFGEHEVLVPAIQMINWPGVSRVTGEGPVSYVHVMFEDHQIICADGAWSESFQPGPASLSGLGLGQRDEILQLFPELSCGAAYPAARMTLKSHEARLLMPA